MPAIGLSASFGLGDAARVRRGRRSPVPSPLYEPRPARGELAARRRTRTTVPSRRRRGNAPRARLPAPSRVSPRTPHPARRSRRRRAPTPTPSCIGSRVASTPLARRCGRGRLTRRSVISTAAFLAPTLGTEFEDFAVVAAIEQQHLGTLTPQSALSCRGKPTSSWRKPAQGQRPQRYDEDERCAPATIFPSPVTTRDYSVSKSAVDRPPL